MSRHATLEPILKSFQHEVVALRERLTSVEASDARKSAEIAALKDEVKALQAELAAREAEPHQKPTREKPKNSSNSSKPPASDHPHDPKSERKPPNRERKPPSDREQGAQPGHPGKTRPLGPESDVQECCPCIPVQCPHCPTHPALVCRGDEPPPLREQMWELPPIQWHITEYQRHCRTCPDCNRRTWGVRPAEAPRGCLGFRAQGMVGLLTGGAQLTRRVGLRLLHELFELPLSLGTLSNTEALLARALEAADAEIAAAVRAAPVVHCDETPWRAPGEKPWLWVVTTGMIAKFRIAEHRDAQAFAAFKLDQPGQKKVTDRYTVYIHGIAKEDHQVCWGHLDRDFAGWAEHPQAGGAAHWLSDLTGQLFSHWHAFRDEHHDRAVLQQQMAAVQRAVRAALEMGAAGKVPKFWRLCQNLLDRWESLWLWMYHEGVEPTNNTGERALRQGVLWRKVSLFTQSQRGRTYIERMLTVKTTVRNQGGNLLEFLTDSLRAMQAGTSPPKLLPAAAT